MSKQIFSKQEIAILEKNPNVVRVSEKSITYSTDFKSNFIDEYERGKLPREIFEAYGFDVQMIGKIRIEQAAYRWRTAYEKNGFLGLVDSRHSQSGRTKTPTTPEEVIAQQQAKIDLLEGQIELLKKFDKIERRLLSQSLKLQKNNSFALIQQTIEKHNLKGMTRYLCQLMNVSRSGYYAFLAAAPIREAYRQAELQTKTLILKIFKRRGYLKGSRSIKMILENEFNICLSRKKICKIMNKYDIVCPHRKANPYKRIAKATKEHRVVPNSLARNFKQDIPGKVLLTDITYVPYNGNCMAYLSTIKDGATNEILAYHVSDRITLAIATDTIHKLKANKRITLHPDAFIHSDQGSHYTSPNYQKLLKASGLGQSMSRRGNCWDNAPMESFFGHFKDEVDYKAAKTLQELKHKIDHYMVYYNNYRYQWNLKKMAPIQYRNHLLSI
ncbi:MAG: IS3 family transposase [Culicoidibacterales bacterium]